MQLNLKLCVKDSITSNPSPKPNPNSNLKAKPTSTPRPNPNHNVVDHQLSPEGICSSSIGPSK